MHIAQNIASATSLVNSQRLISARYHAAMVHDIRLARLQQLRALLLEHNNNQADLARTLKKSPSQINQWLTERRSITEDSAREIEHQARKPVGWMDQLVALQSVQEPAGRYGSDWPLPNVTPHQWGRLSATDIQILESTCFAILQVRDNAPEPEANEWRRVALALAANADLSIGSDAFTQFCIAVDKEVSAGARTPRNEIAQSEQEARVVRRN